MTISYRTALSLTLTCTLGVNLILAQDALRRVPARDIPVPDTVSSPMRAVIGRPGSSILNEHPTSTEGWKALITKTANAAAAGLPELRKRLGVGVESTTIGGVKAFVVTPDSIPAANRDRLLLNVHGGGYVFYPGESGTSEAILMAGYGRMKVIAVDYRMPPDFPYPAALDDAMAVWKEIIKTTNPRKTAIFGTSTGGGMTLAMVLRAKQEGLPLPAAIAPGTPWADLTKTGDTYYTNEQVDNAIVSYDGLLADMAKLYANGHDLKDPMLSPVYGDYHGFPPSILTSGTRDLFLSNTVRVHRKMRGAGVDAQLHVFEGQSHAQYLSDPSVPETKEYFDEVTRFLVQHLAK
jgi:epsilon-lactone hydrolase